MTLPKKKVSIMKRNFSFFHSKEKIYMKFLYNMFMILIIPFLILLFVYSGLNSKLKEQMYERNLAVLESSVQKIDLLFDNLDQIMLYFKDNVNIMNFINMDPDSMNSSASDMLRAQNDLASMKIANNDVLNIQMYSGLSNSMIDYYTIAHYMDRYYGSSFYLQDLTYKQYQKKYLKNKEPITYSKAVMTVSRITYDVLAYNLFYTGTYFKCSNNRIIFYVNKDSILQFFNPVDYRENGFVCIIDEAGQVLLEDSLYEYDIQNIDYQKFTDNNGYTNMSINGKKMFVTYYRSNRGWLYLEAIPSYKVIAVTNDFRILVFSLLILAIIVGSMLVLLTARKLSKPIIEVGSILGRSDKQVPLEDFVDEITKIVESNKDLMNKMKHQVSVMRTETFYKLLTGECGSELAISEGLKSIGVNLNAVHYVILLLTCNDINLDATLEEISAHKVFLDKVIREQDILELQDIYQIDFERMIILLVSDHSSKRYIREKAETLISNVMEILKEDVYFSISVGGDLVNNIHKLPKAFMHAQRALNITRNVFGIRKIQWYDRVKQYIEMESHDLTMPEDANISSQNLAMIESIKEYINENYNNTQLSLTSIGEEFFITEVYLSKLFKKATGENFSKYIEGIRMNKAKELLDQGKRVREAAELVGYNSPQVFRRAWKRYFGGTPSENTKQQYES